MQFDQCGSLRVHVLGLLVYLGTYVELLQEDVDINLVLDGHNSRLEVLSEFQIIVAVSLSCFLVPPPLIDEVLIPFL